MSLSFNHWWVNCKIVAWKRVLLFSRLIIAAAGRKLVLLFLSDKNLRETVIASQLFIFLIGTNQTTASTFSDVSLIFTLGQNMEPVAAINWDIAPTPKSHTFWGRESNSGNEAITFRGFFPLFRTHESGFFGSFSEAHFCATQRILLSLFFFQFDSSFLPCTLGQ